MDRLINEEDDVVSCHYSSKVTGHYHIRTGNVAWKTRCRMNGIPGCGNGVWALVMRINGSRVCCHQSLSSYEITILGSIVASVPSLDLNRIGSKVMVNLI